MTDGPTVTGTPGVATTPSSFAGPDSPDLTELRKCVHCGICLPQCPTFLTLEEEMDSPRGRLYLIRAVAEGRLPLTDTVTRHLDRCLGCRACETACPSGVPFGRLLESARSEIARRDARGDAGRASLLFRVFPHPDRVGLALRALDLYSASGLRTLVRASGVLSMFPRLAAMDSLIERAPHAAYLPERIAARGTRRGVVGLLTGCVQRHLYPDVNRDTARLLSLAGWDVVIPRGQGCCGALELHAGHVDAYRGRARALAAAFDGVDVVVVNAAGCGSAMKEYDHWIDDARVRSLAARTLDVSELLATADLPLGRLEVTVTYHDACHLAHGQRIRTEPRELLRRIPGLTLVELRESDLCCGSAGIYNLLEPQIAAQLLDRKIARLVETGARVVAAGNPGCLMQIARGCRERGVDLEVVHPVQLLARAVEAHETRR